MAAEDAVGLVEDWAAIEHAAAVAKATAAVRAATGSAVRDAGLAIPGSVARRTGTSTAQVREALATGRRLKDLPATDGAACRAGCHRPVRDLLGESIRHLVLTTGTGVANVTYLGRGPSAAQRIALLWQAPACTRQGCNHRARLEVDHRTSWVQCRVTRLGDLDPLCHHDHQLKTHHGWALITGTGARPMVPPGHPDHPGPPEQRPPPAGADDP